MPGIVGPSLRPSGAALGEQHPAESLPCSWNGKSSVLSWLVVTMVFSVALVGSASWVSSPVETRAPDAGWQARACSR
jgi:hypothetical protein